MRAASAFILKSILSAAALLAFTACDDSDGTNGGNGGPLTQCDLDYTVKSQGGKDFGERCTQDSECRFNECIMPNASGNITNTQFGFCTRGCDCENAEAAQLTVEEKEVLECLYPSGFKSMHHVVVECDSVDDCKALDDGWTDCRLPDSGGARKVCHAI